MLARSLPLPLTPNRRSLDASPRRAARQGAPFLQKQNNNENRP
jgi:hypothetical protein